MHPNSLPVGDRDPEPDPATQPEKETSLQRVERMCREMGIALPPERAQPARSEESFLERLDQIFGKSREPGEDD
jgi:hypothetical protein